MVVFRREKPQQIPVVGQAHRVTVLLLLLLASSLGGLLPVVKKCNSAEEGQRTGGELHCSLRKE